jgi:hypothetical protein
MIHAKQKTINQLSRFKEGNPLILVLSHMPLQLDAVAEHT